MFEPDCIVIRSTLSSRLIQRVLIRGILLSSLGLLPFLWGGVFFPPELLDRWGWILFLFFLTALGCGLLPYKWLLRAQMHPDRILLTLKEGLHFQSYKRPVLILSEEHIEKFSFYQKGCLYLDFANFLDTSSETVFLQLNKFLGRGRKPLPSKFMTLQFDSLSNLYPKNLQSRVYGIRCHLKPTALSKNLENQYIDFPYFSLHSCRELQEWLQTQKQPE